MTSKQTVFLDTSIQIQRTLSEFEEVERLNVLLSAPTIQPITSAYVWMEYQRSVVADFAHVYQLMLRHTDWGGLFGHVLDGDRAFRPRSAVRCNKIIGNYYTASEHNWENAKYAIAEQIQYGLYERFWMNVLPTPDLIACDLVTTGISLQSDRTYAVAASCRKESAMCALPTFLASQQQKLRDIATNLAQHSNVLKDQPRLERLLAAILDDPRAALGQTSCWPLGDLIIALQVPPGASLWTLDADFAPLAAILEIPLYEP